MQELWVYLYAGSGLVSMLSIIKIGKTFYNNWKTRQLNKIIHASKRKNGRAGHTHK